MITFGQYLTLMEAISGQGPSVSPSRPNFSAYASQRSNMLGSMTHYGAFPMPFKGKGGVNEAAGDDATTVPNIMYYLRPTDIDFLNQFHPDHRPWALLHRLGPGPMFTKQRMKQGDRPSGVGDILLPGSVGGRRGVVRYSGIRHDYADFVDELERPKDTKALSQMLPQDIEKEYRGGLYEFNLDDVSEHGNELFAKAYKSPSYGPGNNTGRTTERYKAWVQSGNTGLHGNFNARGNRQHGTDHGVDKAWKAGSYPESGVVFDATGRPIRIEEQQDPKTGKTRPAYPLVLVRDEAIADMTGAAGENRQNGQWKLFSDGSDPRDPRAQSLGNGQVKYKYEFLEGPKDKDERTQWVRDVIAASARGEEVSGSFEPVDNIDPVTLPQLFPGLSVDSNGQKQMEEVVKSMNSLFQNGQLKDPTGFAKLQDEYRRLMPGSGDEKSIETYRHSHQLAALHNPTYRSKWSSSRGAGFFQPLKDAQGQHPVRGIANRGEIEGELAAMFVIDLDESKGTTTFKSPNGRDHTDLVSAVVRHPSGRMVPSPIMRGLAMGLQKITGYKNRKQNDLVFGYLPVIQFEMMAYLRNQLNLGPQMRTLELLKQSEAFKKEGKEAEATRALNQASDLHNQAVAQLIERVWSTIASIGQVNFGVGPRKSWDYDGATGRVLSGDSDLSMDDRGADGAGVSMSDRLQGDRQKGAAPGMAVDRTHTHQRGAYTQGQEVNPVGPGGTLMARQGHRHAIAAQNMAQLHAYRGRRTGSNLSAQEIFNSLEIDLSNQAEMLQFYVLQSLAQAGIQVPDNDRWFTDLDLDNPQISAAYETGLAKHRSEMLRLAPALRKPTLPADLVQEIRQGAERLKVMIGSLRGIGTQKADIVARLTAAPPESAEFDQMAGSDELLDAIKADPKAFKRVEKLFATTKNGSLKQTLARAKGRDDESDADTGDNAMVDAVLDRALKDPAGPEAGLGKIQAMLGSSRVDDKQKAILHKVLAAAEAKGISAS